MKHYNIKVNRQEALRYLGYRGSKVDGVVGKQLDRAVSTLEKVSVPSYIYRTADIEIIPAAEAELENGSTAFPENPTSTGKTEDKAIRLKGTSVVLTGNSAVNMLSECSQCIMLAATIGRQVDQAIHRSQVTDMSGAVILDSCASSAVESICDQLQADIEADYMSKGLYLTDRFSPGYGDLPIDLQPVICRALSAEKTIGLTITSGMLMMPTKSVTAFIGISDRPQPKRLTGCANCSMKKYCKYRKAGVTCAS
ncbi:MAG: hypothetical protein SOV71_05100 [Anaerovoracaceae bacterium]|nr:vitamin B12 dependent-methionine synthase activation domain-containing protein [Bacillota bacterium]MDY2670915.1 hypothetical protein [Anaerovoracaceae bacterium]